MFWGLMAAIVATLLGVAYATATCLGQLQDEHLCHELLVSAWIALWADQKCCSGSLSHAEIDDEVVMRRGKCIGVL